MPSWGGELLPWSLQLLVYPSQEIRTLPRPTLHRSRRHHLRTSLDRTVRPGKLRSSRGRGRRSHVPRFALDRRGVALRVEVESVGVGTGKRLRLRWGRGHDVGCCVSEHSCLTGTNSSKIAFNRRIHSRVLVELLLILGLSRSVFHPHHSCRFRLVGRIFMKNIVVSWHRLRSNLRISIGLTSSNNHMFSLIEFYHDIAVDFGFGWSTDDDCLLGHDYWRRWRLVLHKYLFGGTFRSLYNFGWTYNLLRTLSGDDFLGLERQIDRIGIKFLQIEDLVGMWSQQFFNPQTAQPLPLIRVTHPSHNISQQRWISPEPLPFHSKFQIMPNPHSLTQLPQINRIIFNAIQLLSIEQRTRLQQGDPNGKRLG